MKKPDEAHELLELLRSVQGQEFPVTQMNPPPASPSSRKKNRNVTAQKKTLSDRIKPSWIGIGGIAWLFSVVVFEIKTGSKNAGDEQTPAKKSPAVSQPVVHGQSLPRVPSTANSPLAKIVPSPLDAPRLDPLYSPHENDLNAAEGANDRQLATVEMTNAPYADASEIPDPNIPSSYHFPVSDDQASKQPTE